jgi:hypothetical protein
MTLWNDIFSISLKNLKWRGSNSVLFTRWEGRYSAQNGLRNLSRITWLLQFRMTTSSLGTGILCWTSLKKDTSSWEQREAFPLSSSKLLESVDWSVRQAGAPEKHSIAISEHMHTKKKIDKTAHILDNQTEDNGTILRLDVLLYPF